MENIEDIIVGSYNENPTSVKNAFNNIMREKILAALEDRMNGNDTDSDDESFEEDDSDVEDDGDDESETEDNSDTEES